MDAKNVRLDSLSLYLKNLPLPLHQNIPQHDFRTFDISETDIEDYDDEESAVNHWMEVIIGSRVKGITLTEKGLGLEAAVDVLRNYNSKNSPAILLWKWVDDLVKMTVNYSKFALIPTVKFTVIYR
jgi:hypothetical protein